MPEQARANPNHNEPNGADDSRRQPRMLYVDFAQLEATVSGNDALRVYGKPAQRRATVAGRVTLVKDEVADLRRNVRDAARAVLTWLASVTQHGDTGAPGSPGSPGTPGDLDRVLDKCLRPGADTTAVNYTAMAQEINRTLGTDLSPKRIQTAIRHLRDTATAKTRHAVSDQETGKPTLARRLDDLYARLRTNHDRLLNIEGNSGHTLRRAVAHDVLGVLRSAAGRLIECGFGEGIPEHVDLDATRQRFLAFIRRAADKGLNSDNQSSLRDDLARLLGALHDHDDTAEADMQLVAAGVSVVADLAGPDSLAGLMARLNLLMIGRPMLESDFFVSQMLKLADAAGSLIHDRATLTDMSWVRLQPEDRRTPSPNRVRSYCLNNAATHILQRLHTGELTGGRWFETAQRCYDTMIKHDRGFQLIKTTEAIMLCVLADMTGNTDPARELFQKLGGDKSLDLLRDLARFDNSTALNRLVRRHADATHPGIATQLLVLPA
jgi:hypothetical protein